MSGARAMCLVMARRLMPRNTEEGRRAYQWVWWCEEEREEGRTEEDGDDEEDDDETAYDGHWDSDLQILFVPRLSFIHKTPNVSSQIHN